MIYALIQRELRMVFRQPGDMAAGLVFALLVVVLFPFAFSPDPVLLHRLSFGVLLIAVLFAQFLGMEKIFAPDLKDGSLELVALSPMPLALYALCKTFTHWLAHGVALLIAAPLFLLMLGTTPAEIPSALLALLLTTLILSLLGAAGAALSLGARQPGLLLPLLLLPFTLPVLVFGASLAQAGIASAEGLQSFLFLGALFFLYLAASPFLSAAALTSAIESQ